jgi:hypothetical protein
MPFVVVFVVAQKEYRVRGRSILCALNLVVLTGLQTENCWVNFRIHGGEVGQRPGQTRCYGTRSPLQELTRIIDFTFRFPMVHGTVRHRRFHGNCSAAGIRA